MLSKKEICLLLIALCFLVYANSLNNTFVSDDIPAIIKNPLISHPLRFWPEPAGLLNSLNYLIAGYHPFIYHLTNIILHSIVTILIFFFLNLFFKTEASFIGAALFAVHPVHTEAVTWVSGRPYIITALFILITYFLYNSATDFTNPVRSKIPEATAAPLVRTSNGLKTGKKLNLKLYLLCLFIFSYYIINNFTFYSLFPFLLILSDVTFKRWRKNWIWPLPFLGIAILRILLARGLAYERILFVARERGESVSWTNPLFNMAYSLFANFGLLVWPAKLTLYHEPAVISYPALIARIIILFILILSLPLVFKKAKELFFAVVIFILFLTPTYSPVMISWLFAERYLYFPSITLCIIAGFFYERCAGAGSKQLSKALYGSVPKLLILIIAAYAVRTVARNEDWRSPERLWRQTVLASPYSPRGHNNMGDIYYQEGNIEGAIREFKKAIEIKPNYADAYHNLASVYYRKGDLKEAIKFYKLAISLNPGLFESHFDLGIIYLNSGESTLAIEHLKRATQIRPENNDARKALEFAVNKKEGK